MKPLLIPNDLNKRLETLAAKVHLSAEECAAQALEEFLDDQEDYLIALERLGRIEKGIDKTISLEEMLGKLELEEKDLH